MALCHCRFVVWVVMEGSPRNPMPGFDQLVASLQGLPLAKITSTVANLEHSVDIGNPVLAGQPLTKKVIDDAVEFVRKDKGVPLRPSPSWQAPRRLALSDQTDSVAPGGDRAYSWQWLDIAVQWVSEDAASLSSFPLPVAVLSEAHDGSMHLLSLSSLFHLLPQKAKAHVFFQQERHWDAMRALGVGRDSVLSSARSLSLKTGGAASGSGDTPSLPTFSSFMGTPRAWCAIIATMTAAQNQKVQMLKALHEILGAMAKMLPPTAIVLAIDAPQGRIASSELRQLLEATGLLEDWRLVKAVELASVDVVDGHIPLADLLWFSFRAWGRNQPSTLCKQLAIGLMESFVGAWVETFGNRLHSSIPLAKLPHDVSGEVLKGLRGDDKLWQKVHPFLGKRQGKAAGADIVLDELIHSPEAFKSHKQFVVRKLNAAWFVACRKEVRARIEGTVGIGGEIVLYDASRVSSLEVLLVHIWSKGIYIVAPLQILPDAASTLFPSQAAASMTKVVLEGKGSSRKTLGESTRLYAISVWNSLRSVLPPSTSRSWTRSERGASLLAIISTGTRRPKHRLGASLQSFGAAVMAMVFAPCPSPATKVRKATLSLCSLRTSIG
jgi:hypothetical protein